MEPEASVQCAQQLLFTAGLGYARCYEERVYKEAVIGSWGTANSHADA
jgi:hypothetical protein